MNLSRTLPVLLFLSLAACGRSDHLGRAPGFTPTMMNTEHMAMIEPGLPRTSEPARNRDQASLWSRNRESLLGDRRAAARGDILTVVIEINDKAEFQNSTRRARSGSEGMGISQLFGLPQRLQSGLPAGATVDPAVSINSTSAAEGDGTVKRNEKLTLRVAATIVDVLPNGVLSISGTQEVRLNFEIRELLITGFVRPEDISRQNEITYDKIASARVSYGGRGQLSDMQQPRYGQQLLDMVLPF